MKTGLLEIHKFIIPRPVIEETIHFLRVMGHEGCEGFVLWGGRILSQDTFTFESALIPEQRSGITERGLLVTVDGEALFRINKTLHERGMILGAQVHSHPTEAYHSSTDDQYPLATLLGALSIVVPNLAQDTPQDLQAWAWYRLAAYERWEALTDDTSIELT